MASENTTTDLILRTSQPEPANAHSFFVRWPREIRDKIYDLLFQEKKHTTCKMAFTVEASYSKTRTTLPNLHLVSSQMKIEYDECDRYHLPKNTYRVCQVNSLNAWSRLGPCRFRITAPTLAIRSTVLHLDLKCCGEEQDPKKCLVPADGSSRGIGGSKMELELRTSIYLLADFPLLEKMYFHVSCAAALKRAADMSPAGGHLPADKIPMLAQISTFRTEYVQAPSLEDSVRSERHELRDMSSLSQPGGFLVRRKTQAIWTHVNGWNNEALLDYARECETWYSDVPVSSGNGSPWKTVVF